MGELFVREYKYLGLSYLAQSFNEITRQRCFAFHEGFVLAALREDLIADFHKRGLRLFAFYQGENLFSLTLGPTPEHRREGEASIVFSVNNHPVYVLSFSVIPGAVVGLEAAETLLIARMQGHKGAFEGIGEATKALRDVAPQAALAAALDGIARALWIGRVVGISGRNGCSFIAPRPLEPFLRAYDEFYASLGGEPLSEGFFQLTVPFPRKPLNAVKPGHRLRTKRKQEIKEQIAESAFRAMRSALDERFLATRAVAAPFDVGRQAELQGHLQRIAAENSVLEQKLADLERERAEILSRPPKFLQPWLGSRVALFRNIAERLEARRLRALEFDAQYYLEQNHDLRISGARAALHYVRRGRGQRREARLGAAQACAPSRRVQQG